MTQTRLIALLVLLLAACHPPKPVDPTPDGGSGQEPAPGTPPTFTVHMPDDLKATFQLYRSVHVLLGDGSRFRERLDGSGVVRFHDPAIVGPQDVSLVMVRSTGEVAVKTYLSLDGPRFGCPAPWVSSRPFPGRSRAPSPAG